MSDDIDVNKVSPKQERQAEHIKDKLEKKGMGQDQAADEALHQVVEKEGYSSGGGNSAGDSHKHANHQGKHHGG